MTLETPGIAEGSHREPPAPAEDGRQTAIFGARAKPSEALARVAPLGEWVQDCEPPSGCGADGLDPAWCLAEPSPFDVTFLDGEAVAITVDEDVVATLGLAPGEWWTAWSTRAS